MKTDKNRNKFMKAVHFFELEILSILSSAIIYEQKLNWYLKNLDTGMFVTC